MTQVGIKPIHSHSQGGDVPTDSLELPTETSSFKTFKCVIFLY